MLSKFRIIIFIACLLLLGFICGAFLISYHIDGFPLGATYNSWLEIPAIISFTVLSLAVLLGFVLLKIPEKLNRLIFFGCFSGILLAAFSFTIYHAAYNDHPKVQAFMDYEEVIPYHVQLASICFVYSSFISLVFVFSAKVHWLWRIGALLSALLPLFYISWQ